MARILDFNTFKEPILDIVLADERKTRLRLKTPSKAVVDKLQHILRILSTYENKNDEELIALGAGEEIYDTAHILLNNNLENKEFSRAEVEKLFDYSDLTILFTYYLEFLNEISNLKN